MKDKQNPEAEYFARIEQEKKQKLAEQVAAEKAEAEREERKRVHAGHCGRCGGAMQVKPFRGIEIDVCPECGSVLLDPGELEAVAGEDKAGVLASITALFDGHRHGRHTKKH
jgi:Zn-finger nucleic acid-binding protein